MHCFSVFEIEATINEKEWRLQLTCHQALLAWRGPFFDGIALPPCVHARVYEAIIALRQHAPCSSAGQNATSIFV